METVDIKLTSSDEMEMINIASTYLLSKYIECNTSSNIKLTIKITKEFRDKLVDFGFIIFLKEACKEHGGGCKVIPIN